MSTQTQDMKIFIKHFGNISIPLDVNSSDEIYNVIEKYKTKTHISGDLYLTYANIILESNNKIEDYMIKNGTTFHVISSEKDEIIIFVKIQSKNYIPLALKPNNLISDIKQQLSDLHGIKRDDKVLIYENEELNDGNVIMDYKIINNSLLFLNDKCENIHINVFIGSFIHEQITIEAHLNEKIFDIKKKIQKIKKIPIEEQIIIVDDEMLDDFKSINDCQILDNSNILLIQRYIEYRTVKIKSFDGKSISINIRISDSISYLKKEIEKTEKIPIDQQILFFNGEEINDSDLIQIYFYNKSCYSRLDLVKSTRKDNIIFIKKGLNQIFPIEINHKDKIFEIKTKIEKKFGYHLNDQQLFYESKELENEKTLQDYQIPLNSKCKLSFQYKKKSAAIC